MCRVSLVKGDERYKNVKQSLKLIGDDITWNGFENIVIKPNFVSTSRQLAATHVDCVRAILDFLGDKKVIIAESPAMGSASDGYENFGYYSLKDNYRVEFKDLDDEGSTDFYLPNRNFKPVKIEVSNIISNPKNFIISPAKLKTHDSVVATLSLKNIIMGAVKNKVDMHQGPRCINYNLFNLATCLFPNLSVIDGFRGMEGGGPTYGEAVETKVGIASVDFLAADRVGLEIMGIKPEDVGYLYYCSLAGLGMYDLENIEILGEDINTCKKKFKLHSTVNEQLEWK